MAKKKIAVILCGSGYKDGSEIRESVATLWALSQEPVDVQCFAPDTNQYDVVNCLTGNTDPKAQPRNQLIEAARIARGQVKALSELNPKDFAAVILPGGFGVAKNLCTFAFQGSQGEVLSELKSRLQEFHAQKKPIGAICISPALIALAFPQAGFELTVGDTCEASVEIEKLGHKHIVCKANDCIVDTKNRIASTPAYMCDTAPLHEIFAGIQKLVQLVCK